MDYLFLTQTVLFSGVAEKELAEMLDCMGAKEKSYGKGDVIFHMGEAVSCMGLVLSGSAIVENHDVWGNRTILSRVEGGEIFAETYACIPGEPMMVEVSAAEPTAVLFLNTARLIEMCSGLCAHHSRLIKNLLQISSQKNLELSRKILHTSAKTIRGRLSSYFSQQVKQKGYDFTIPFNRQQLADYLGVDRSAMSNELSKMQKEGLLSFSKNRFNVAQPFTP